MRALLDQMAGSIPDEEFSIPITMYINWVLLAKQILLIFPDEGGNMLLALRATFRKNYLTVLLNDYKERKLSQDQLIFVARAKRVCDCLNQYLKKQSEQHSFLYLMSELLSISYVYIFKVLVEHDDVLKNFIHGGLASVFRYFFESIERVEHNHAEQGRGLLNGNCKDFFYCWEYMYLCMQCNLPTYIDMWNERYEPKGFFYISDDESDVESDDCSVVSINLRPETESPYGESELSPSAIELQLTESIQEIDRKLNNSDSLAEEKGDSVHPNQTMGALIFSDSRKCSERFTLQAEVTNTYEDGLFRRK